MKSNRVLKCVSGVLLAGCLAYAQTAPVAPAPASAGRKTIIQQGVFPTLAWWVDTPLVNQMGLTDVQKSRIQGAFGAYSQSLQNAMEALDKEEAQMSKLVNSETVDRSAIITALNRVIQARGEVERINSTMMLEMREQLTLAQWLILQPPVVMPGGSGRGRGQR